VTTKHFIKNLKSSFAFKDINVDKKKKSLQVLLEKLNKRKISIMKSMGTSLEKQKLQEDLDIITLHIKKGEKLLHDLSSKKVV